MNVRKFIMVLLSFFSIMSVNAQSNVFAYDSLYAGQVNVMGQMIDLPDFGRWHYFAFDETQGVIVKGTSEFELENVNAGKVGTEKISAEWQARTDWDFAFHACDFRTNSGLAGNGNAGAIFIADSVSAQETSLDAIYAALTEAPDSAYHADTMTSGTFYLSLTQGMPPLRATTLSLNAATRKAAEGKEGASADFAAFAMQGGATENPMIIVLKTTSGKYVKIFLKQFVEEGKPGFLKFDYAFIPLEGTIGISSIENANVAIYPNPVSNVLNINLSEPAVITIYNLAGMLVQALPATLPQTTAIPVSGWAKGTYIVKIDSAKGSQIQKVIVK